MAGNFDSFVAQTVPLWTAAPLLGSTGDFDGFIAQGVAYTEYAAGGISGQLASTLAAATLAAAGQLAIAGQLAATLAAATLVSTGQVRIAGQLTATLAAATLVAAGQGPQPVHAQLAVVLAAATLVATNVRVAIELGTVYGQADTATIYGQQVYGEVIGI